MTSDSVNRLPEDRRHLPALFDTALDESLVPLPVDWYKGPHFQYYPTNDALCEEDGLDFILRGGLPSEPLITPASRVLAMGSCFAANILDWLDERGLSE